MKVAISIPDSIFDEAESLARRLGTSRSQLYAQAVAEYLEGHRSDRVTEKLDAVYDVEHSELDPALAQAQFEVLEDEGW